MKKLRAPTPHKRPRQRAIKRVVAAFILHRDKILICQRTKYQSMPLQWEFPGGKIETGEQPQDALRRELEEELGIDAHIGDEVTRVLHRYKRGGTVELRFFVVEKYVGEIDNRIFKDVRWATRKELPIFDFLEADAQVVAELAAGKIL